MLSNLRNTLGELPAELCPGCWNVTRRQLATEWALNGNAFLTGLTELPVVSVIEPSTCPRVRENRERCSSGLQFGLGYAA